MELTAELADSVEASKNGSGTPASTTALQSLLVPQTEPVPRSLLPGATVEVIDPSLTNKAQSKKQKMKLDVVDKEHIATRFHQAPTLVQLQATK